MFRRITSLIVPLLLLMAINVRASEEFHTYITEIIPPDEGDNITLVLLSAGGRVLRIPTTDVRAISELEEVAKRNEAIQIKVKDHGDYDEIKEVLPALPFLMWEEENLAPNDGGEAKFESRYTPGQLWTFMRSKNLRKNSQCFWRAYLWGHDAHTQLGVSTHKVFMFFTRKYIREYNYKWWFHVSPFVYDSAGQERVLDATFSNGPISMQTWTNKFVRPHPVCPTISKYTGYGNHHTDRYCYLRKPTMYYYHPSSTQNADVNNQVITSWCQSCLKTSQKARP